VIRANPMRFLFLSSFFLGGGPRPLNEHYGRFVVVTNLL